VFLVSCIIPLFNAKRYLPEAVESVKAQTIGFERVQLVLVNDGSMDGSDSFCRAILEQCPNAVYAEQSNAGVSAARNLGIRLARGRHVVFLDADDKLDPRFMEAGIELLGECDADFAAFRILCEDMAETAAHAPPEPKRFLRTRVIDAEAEPHFVQYSASSALFRADALKARAFDEGMRHAEDAEFMHRVVLEKMKYGVVSGVHYRYRQRGDSARHGKFADAEWYGKGFADKITQYSVKRRGYVTQYSQALCIYDLMDRFVRDMPEGAPPEAVAAARRAQAGLCREILPQISNRAIIGSTIPILRKYFLLGLKNGGFKLNCGGQRPVFEGGDVQIAATPIICLTSAEKRGGEYVFCGYIPLPGYDGVEFSAQLGDGAALPLERSGCRDYDVYFLGSRVQEAYAFNLAFAAPYSGELRFVAKMCGKAVRAAVRWQCEAPAFVARGPTRRMDSVTIGG
jgi:glycosyltransferase involved in cell wall biosynthesis